MKDLLARLLIFEGTTVTVYDQNGRPVSVKGNGDHVYFEKHEKMIVETSDDGIAIWGV